MRPDTLRLRVNAVELLWLLLAFALHCGVADAEPLPHDLAERKLARLLDMINTTSGPVERATSTSLLASDWPNSLKPTVMATLAAVLKKPDTDLYPVAVRIFAERNRQDAAILVPYIAASLPKLDHGDDVELLRAVRAIGPRASSLEAVVRHKLADSDAVVVIHAASALIRIAPTNRYVRARLLGYLSSDRPEIRWRACDAIARSDGSDKRWVAELRELLRDNDVRVRVTSAYALWRITRDAGLSVPVLLASLAENDANLATAYVFPSYQGESHRVYTLEALMEMAPPSRSVIPTIVSVVRDVASAESPVSDRNAILGLAALHAVRDLGSVTEAEFKEIEESVGCNECAFSLVRDQAEKLLASIKKTRLLTD